MDLFSGKVKLESFRVIGLKDADKDRLAEASRETSFDATEAVVMPDTMATIESTPVMEEVAPMMDANIFDQTADMVEAPSPAQVSSVLESTIFEAPEASAETPAPVDESNVYTESVMDNNDLNTPQGFFAKEEVPEMVNNAALDDPALILADNLKKLIEDKNEMIEALNNKVEVLTEQLRQSEEARKVSEAQKEAAETTLAEARRAEDPNGGPTLVYQQAA